MARRFGSQGWTSLTLALVGGLLLALGAAVYLAHWGEVSVRDAFGYQSAVVAAQRDSELLEVEQYDRQASPSQLRPYEKLLSSDLARIDQVAATFEERPPPFSFPAKRQDYEHLTTQLQRLSLLGEERFDRLVARNSIVRYASSTLFAIVALLFVAVQSRLRRRIEENRSIVERLQRAFISRMRRVRNIDAGGVLISATRGSNVGGDLHDLFSIDGHRALFVVADVSGKGIDAAVDTALVKYSLRALFSEHDDPGVILSKFASLYARAAENPETFVVVFVGVIDLDDGTVRYASAGHEPAWACLGQDVVQLPNTGPIIGLDAETRYETQVLHLRAGNAIVVTTDGLTESRDSRGRMLGVDGVNVWLSESEGDAQKIADAIVMRLRGRSSRIADDLAILVVRFVPALLPGQRSSSEVITAAGTPSP